MREVVQSDFLKAVDFLIARPSHLINRAECPFPDLRQWNEIPNRTHGLFKILSLTAKSPLHHITNQTKLITF